LVLVFRQISLLNLPPIRHNAYFAMQIRFAWWSGYNEPEFT